MSSSIAKIYTDTVRENQRVLYGVWEPGFPVKLGDYGVMNGNIFVQLGNIRDIPEMNDFEIVKRLDDTKDEKFFTSQKGVKFDIKPQVKITPNGIPINASIDISFTRENSIFFNAAECQFEMIENKYQIGKKLLEIHKKNKNTWKREFVLVTDRVIAKRALILISTSRDYSVSFEADSNVPVIDLSKASLGLNIKSQKSSGYRISTEEGLIPLIGLSKITPSFLWFEKRFKPIFSKYNKMMTQTIQDSDNIKTEKSEEELIFIQYTEDLNK